MSLRVLLLCSCALLLVACGGDSAGAGPTFAPLPPIATSTSVAIAPPPTRAPTTLLPVAATVMPATPMPTPAPAPTAAATPVAANDDTPLLDEANAAPTAAPSPAGVVAVTSDPARIVIESIEMDRPLVSVGLDPKRQPIVPQHDAGWYNLSARPGQGENVVLWGHVLRFKSTPDIAAPFARIKELQPGDAITLYTVDGAPHAYQVQRQVWATPDQVAYILPTGSEQLTLVSCIGDKVILDGSLEMTHRLVTIAVPE